MIAATTAANMKPIEAMMMRPERDGDASRTSCVRTRSPGAGELVESLALPPLCLGTCSATSPSAALDTCANHAACRRLSGSSGSVGALRLWWPSVTVAVRFDWHVVFCTARACVPYK